MNRQLLLVPFLAVFAACNSSTPANAPAQPDTATSRSAQAAPDNTASPVAAENSLPEGVIISEPYQLRADRVVTNNDGLVRRQVTFEYPDTDFASAPATLEAAFTTAGFKARPQKTQPSGDTLLSFDKKQYGTAYAILKNAPSSASTRRSLLLDFPGK